MLVEGPNPKKIVPDVSEEPSAKDTQLGTNNSDCLVGLFLTQIGPRAL